MSEHPALLDPSSLYHTVDAVNEVLFFEGSVSNAEARRILRWLESRVGEERAYAGGFAPTEEDFAGVVHSFTGDRLTCASMRHSLTEEASRVATLLSHQVGRHLPALERANEGLGQRISECAQRYPGSFGTFCCGPCTAALWRRLAVDGEDFLPGALEAGIQGLKKRREDGKGWNRMPLLLTLSALLEAPPELAGEELHYIAPLAEKRLRRTRANGPFGPRRIAILERTLEAAA